MRLAAGTVRNFDDAKRTDERAYAAFFHAMLAEGVAMAPGAYEAIFVGLAHTDEVLARIAERPTAPRWSPVRSASLRWIVRQLFSGRFVAALPRARSPLSLEAF